MPAAVVGSLRVLLSADSAQITSDLGKARAAVKETGAEIRGMGGAGVALRAVTTEIKGVGPALRGVQQASQIATQSLALLGEKTTPAVSSLTNALGGLLAGGFTPLGVALAAISVGFSLLASQKEEIVSVFAATEERVKSTREGLEKLRIELGLLRQGKTATAADVDIAGAEDELRRRKNVVGRERQAGFIGSEGVGSFWRNLGSSVLPTEGFLPSIDSAEEAARRAVREQEEFIRTLREQQKVQTEIDQRRKSTEETAKREAASQEKIAAAAKAAAEALAKFDAAETTRDRALREKRVELQSLLNPGTSDASLDRQKGKVHDAIEDLMKAAKASPEERRELEARIRFERDMLDLLEQEQRVRREIAAIESAAAKADALRKENDRAALDGNTSLTDRAKALAAARTEFEEMLGSKEMAALPAASPERARLLAEFRRKEDGINRDFDEKGVEAQRAFLSRVDAIRRQAQAATLADDRNQTRIRLEEEDVRHDAELRSVNDAQTRGFLTEEQAAQKRDGLYAAHIEFRQAITREGREKELAWQADYQQRLLALAGEGETDQARLAALATEQRLAALQEETRKQVEELRRRGELTRAQEVENAAAGARERIARQGQLQQAVTGDDFAAGFQGRISQIREETAGWGQLGAQMADVAVNDLSGGVASALEEIARGSKSATEAFREFAADFAFQVARMIEQALIMKAILSLFPGLGGAAGGAAGAGAGAAAASAAPAATGAHGGTWRVGGFGGLDSQLVSMKLSPGELVRVSNGANSGGEGDVHVALTVRPPAVIADEVMARSSPDARAAIVSSALRRSGRRGMRPRD
jgi:lambda family phage tail tape measure protein